MPLRRGVKSWQQKAWRWKEAVPRTRRRIFLLPKLAKGTRRTSIKVSWPAGRRSRRGVANGGVFVAAGGSEDSHVVAAAGEFFGDVGHVLPDGGGIGDESLGDDEDAGVGGRRGQGAGLAWEGGGGGAE